MALPFQPCPGVLRLIVRFLVDGQAVNNIAHIYNGTGAEWTQGQIQSILTYMTGTWWPNIVKPLCASTVTFEGVQATDLTDQHTLQIEDTTNAGQAGTEGAAAMPNSVTAAIRFFTGYRTKGVNGRVFMPPIPTDKVTGNTLNQAYGTSWVTAWNTLRTQIPLLVGGAALSVLHRYENKQRKQLGTTTPVTLIQMANDAIDVQKNRLPQHRKHKKPATP